MSRKRAQGQFYTRGNPFKFDPFRRWAKTARLPHARVLEPFAGANHIISALREIGACDDFASYDLTPAHEAVKKRNTIANFPKGYDVCVTNPPWLARNSATRRGLEFPDSRHDDLYKHCLELCLNHCEHVAILVPASFLHAGLFRSRLRSYVLLHDAMFSDTENPACLALFDNQRSRDVSVYYDNRYMGALDVMRKSLPVEKNDNALRFNDPRGSLGFISFDNTKEPSIRFCEAKEIEDYPVKVSSRFITRISGNFRNVPALVEKLNHHIKLFRRSTADVFLTPFKGMRDDGFYRRRMSFDLARKFINALGL